MCARPTSEAARASWRQGRSRLSVVHSGADSWALPLIRQDHRCADRASHFLGTATTPTPTPSSPSWRGACPDRVPASRTSRWERRARGTDQRPAGARLRGSHRRSARRASTSNPRAYDDLADLAEFCAEAAPSRSTARRTTPCCSRCRAGLVASAADAGPSAAFIDKIAVQIVLAIWRRAARPRRCSDTLYSDRPAPRVLRRGGATWPKRCPAPPRRKAPEGGPEGAARTGGHAGRLRATCSPPWLVPQGAPLYHWQQTGVDPDAKTAAHRSLRRAAHGRADADHDGLPLPRARARRLSRGAAPGRPRPARSSLKRPCPS